VHAQFVLHGRLSAFDPLKGDSDNIKTEIVEFRGLGTGNQLPGRDVLVTTRALAYSEATTREGGRNAEAQLR